MRCHGMGAKSSGLYPDLRFATRETLEKWDDIVLGGIRAGGGMASFADVLTPTQSKEVQAYVATRALHEPNVAQRTLAFLAENICLPATWFTD
jgi:quinohemoprotein ethanol dehydrogenase